MGTLLAMPWIGSATIPASSARSRTLVAYAIVFVRRLPPLISIRQNWSAVVVRRPQVVWKSALDTAETISNTSVASVAASHAGSASEQRTFAILATTITPDCALPRRRTLLNVLLVLVQRSSKVSVLLKLPIPQPAKSSPWVVASVEMPPAFKTNFLKHKDNKKRKTNVSGREEKKGIAVCIIVVVI